MKKNIFRKIIFTVLLIASILFIGLSASKNKTAYAQGNCGIGCGIDGGYYGPETPPEHGGTGPPVDYRDTPDYEMAVSLGLNQQYPQFVESYWIQNGDGTWSRVTDYTGCLPGECEKEPEPINSGNRIWPITFCGQYRNLSCYSATGNYLNQADSVLSKILGFNYQNAVYNQPEDNYFNDKVESPTYTGSDMELFLTPQFLQFKDLGGPSNQCHDQHRNAAFIYIPEGWWSFGLMANQSTSPDRTCYYCPDSNHDGVYDQACTGDNEQAGSWRGDECSCGNPRFCQNGDCEWELENCASDPNHAGCVPNCGGNIKTWIGVEGTGTSQTNPLSPIGFTPYPNDTIYNLNLSMETNFEQYTEEGKWRELVTFDIKKIFDDAYFPPRPQYPVSSYNWLTTPLTLVPDSGGEMTDSILGLATDMDDSTWTGFDYSGGPVEVVLDLGSPQLVDRISVRFGYLFVPHNPSASIEPPDTTDIYCDNVLVNTYDTSLYTDGFTKYDSTIRRINRSCTNIKLKFTRLLGQQTMRISEIGIFGPVPEPTDPNDSVWSEAMYYSAGWYPVQMSAYWGNIPDYGSWLSSVSQSSLYNPQFWWRQYSDASGTLLPVDNGTIYDGGISGDETDGAIQACTPPQGANNTGTVTVRALMVEDITSDCGTIKSNSDTGTTTFIDGQQFTLNSEPSPPSPWGSQTQNASSFASWSNVNITNGSEHYAFSLTTVPPTNKIVKNTCIHITDTDGVAPSEKLYASNPTFIPLMETLSGGIYENCTTGDCGTITVYYNIGPLGPWFQAAGGDIYASDDIESVIPDDPATTLNRLILDQESGDIEAGLAAYGGSLYIGSMSKTNTYDWRANDDVNQKISDYYDYFIDLFSLSSSSYTNPTGNVLTDKPTASMTDPVTILTYEPSVQTNPITVSGNWSVIGGLTPEKYIIFINGDLVFDPTTDIDIANGGFLAFIISGNITVDPELGFTPANFISSSQIDSADAQLEGIFIAGGTTAAGKGTFSSGTNGSSTDKQLVGRGMFIANNFNLQRDVGPVNNIDTPSSMFLYNPALLFSMPVQMQVSKVKWSEVAP